MASEPNAITNVYNADVQNFSIERAEPSVTTIYNSRTSTNYAQRYNDDLEDLDDDDDQENLPEGWMSAKTQEGDRYYARADEHDPTIGMTTWARPVHGAANTRIDIRGELGRKFRSLLQSEAPTHKIIHDDATHTTLHWYYDNVDSLANDSILWPKKTSSSARILSESRCSIFTEGRTIVEDVRDSKTALDMLKGQMNNTSDTICIIENINADWIQTFGAAPELDLPYEFVLRQASNVERHETLRQSAYVPSLDDIVESALSLGLSLQRKKKEESMKEVIDTLCKVNVSVKTTVENWNLRGASERELHCVSKCVAECDNVLSSLKDKAASSSSDNSQDHKSVSVQALRRQMMDLEFLRLRRFFNLFATIEYDEHVPRDGALGSPTTTFFKRRLDHAIASIHTANGHDRPSMSRPQCYSLESRMSYIRVDKNLCLILVDPRPHVGYITPGRPRRSKVRVNFSHAWAGQGIDIPELLELGDSSIYDTLKLFAGASWHAEILCGEQKLPPTFEDFLEQQRSFNPQPSRSKLHTALDPQAFLLMLASCAWERNLRYLEQTVNQLSFHRIRNADNMEEMSKINGILHDSREDLGILVSQVEHSLTHMPPYLAAYYDRFPRVRHRHKATHFSPVEHLPEILKRASRLERLILNDFQILMSSVSVREGHDSTRQTRLATGVAILAFTYVPLTLVTGIFGMNTAGYDGFAWWAPLVALVAVILFTVGLLTIVLFIRALILQKRKEGRTFAHSINSAALLTALKTLFHQAREVSKDEEAALAKTK